MAAVATAAEAAVTVVAVAAATDAQPARIASGPDWLSVALFSVAAFLVVFALLASELRTPDSRPPPRIEVVRKLYTTTVVETIISPTGPTGTSVTRSTSGGGYSPTYAPPMTTASGRVIP
jgi:hypothetical protein